MRQLIPLGLIAGVLTLAAPMSGCAQEEQNFLAEGEMAPDIEFTGATRYGVLPSSMSLSDFRGETIVLAFFFRARTRG